MEARQVVWAVPRWTDLLWEDWGGSYSVYDCGTGETHLLNELPAEILRLLAASPRPVADIAACLAETCGVSCDRQWREKVGAVIANLAALELISGVGSSS